MQEESSSGSDAITSDEEEEKENDKPNQTNSRTKDPKNCHCLIAFCSQET